MATKFLTKHALNVEAIGRTFKSFWKSRKEFKIRDVGNHVVLFVFQTNIDVDRVLMNEPWSFDKHLVLFKRLENNSSTQKINFSHTLFWIQLDGLPVNKLNIDIAEEVGKTVDTVVSTQFKNDTMGVTLCVLESKLMFQNHFVGAVKLFSKMVRKDGWRLSMRSFPIFVIGVGL